MTYEELLNEANREGLIVKEKDIPGYNGRIYKNRIAINKDIETTTEKACILAEELGHYHTTVGDILDQSTAENRKQELRARVWAYDRLLSLSEIIRAYEHGCQNRHEIAEYLEVTEGFLLEAIERYRAKYGICATCSGYTVYFEPCLAVMKRI